LDGKHRAIATHHHADAGACPGVANVAFVAGRVEPEPDKLVAKLVAAPAGGGNVFADLIHMIILLGGKGAALEAIVGHGGAIDDEFAAVFAHEGGVLLGEVVECRVALQG